MYLETLILFGLVIVLLALNSFSLASRRRSKSFSVARSHFLPKPAPFAIAPSGLGDSASQLRHVMNATFYCKKVMSKAEYRVFRVVESEVHAQRNGCRVLSQTSLGEIIGSDDQKAFHSINSKRVDILIMGPYGDPIAAIEYQGNGHHQSSAAARDAIKREALRKAGVHFIEIMQDHTASEIAQLVRRLFLRPENNSQLLPQDGNLLPATPPLT